MRSVQLSWIAHYDRIHVLLHHPIGQFAPVDTLHFAEAFRTHQLPGRENVDLRRPDSTNVIEAESKIQGKKDFGIHARKESPFVLGRD